MQYDKKEYYNQGKICFEYLWETKLSLGIKNVQTFS
jgi:hypothetical protein